MTALVPDIFDIRLMLKLVYFSDGESVKLGAKQNPASLSEGASSSPSWKGAMWMIQK